MLFGLIKTKKTAQLQAETVNISVPKEERAVTKGNYSMESLIGAIMGVNGWASTLFGGVFGGKVTQRRALSIPTVSRCVTIIADGLSVLDFGLYNRDKKKIYNSPAIQALKNPNPFQSWFNFIHYCVTSLILKGNSVSLLVRNKNFEVTAIYPLNPNNITAYFEDGRLYYRVNSTQKVYYDYEILHIKINCTEDPIWGINPIQQHAQALGISNLATDGQERIYQTGMLKFILKSTSNQSSVEKSATMLKESLNDVIKGDALSTVLPVGVDLEKLSLTPQEAQYIESQKYSDIQIARIFGVPATMVDAKENRETTEEEYNYFYCNTLLPLVINFQEQFFKSLLTESEKAQGLYFKFKFDSLLRVSAKNRADYFSISIRSGRFSPNDTLEMEDMEGYEGGDSKYITQDLIPVDQYPALVDAKISNLEAKKITNEQGSNQDNIL